MNEIIYKWQHGVYDLKDMIKLVKENIITDKDFFDITRFRFEKLEKL